MAENASIGVEVIQVKAIDTDIGSNGEVRYRIRRDPLDNYRNFEIDPITGQIILAQSLDRERQKVYEIRVEAYDLGIPTPLQSDLDLTIYVKNVNDHDPQFIVDEFTANFTENKQPGSQHVLLVNAIDRDDVDEDEEAEAEFLNICYYIVGGNDDGIFELEPLERELFLTKVLDREKKSKYELIVKATEECLRQPNWLSSSSIPFDGNDDSLLKVTIYINDVNDNPPKFTRAMFTGGISTDIDFGTSFMSVTAFDEDSGWNAQIEYLIDGDIVPSTNSEGLDKIRQKQPFLLDPISGEIILNFDPQEGMKGYFEFGVRAVDTPDHVDKAQVQIYLLREDQRVRFVMRNHPTEISAKMPHFIGVLENVTEAIVNVDAYKIHENHDGAIDKTKTDVLLHFVNPRDNTVMEVSDVLKLIDYHTEELDDVFREFDVLNTEGVDPSSYHSHRHYVAYKTGAAVASHQELILLWLIGICVFLVVFLIIIVCLCVHQRSSYARKLRAATASAFGDQATDSILNKRELVPNTNRHASEGSNPIWMTGVGYNSLEFKPNEEEEYEKRELGSEFEKRHYDYLNSSQGEMNQMTDSLDANVLNYSVCAGDDGIIMEGQRHKEEEAASHFSNGGSTIRVASSSKVIDSPRCGSLGVGSENSRKLTQNDLNRGGPKNEMYPKNIAISTLFPSQMPPIEKLGHSEFGNTMYDENDIPRTEL